MRTKQHILVNIPINHTTSVCTHLKVWATQEVYSVVGIYKSRAITVHRVTSLSEIIGVELHILLSSPVKMSGTFTFGDMSYTRLYDS